MSVSSSASAAPQVSGSLLSLVSAASSLGGSSRLLEGR